MPNCTLSQAISGLGGVGKTQLAVEYAYRFHQDYQVVLWAHAESTETLISSYTEIAMLLNLPAKDSQEQAAIVQSVKLWLQNHRDWLLILDNADELDILPAFLPPRLGGHVIITTRAAAPGRFAQRLLVETFAPDQGILFLLRRSGLITPDADVSQIPSQDYALAKQITEEVGGLPLALDQAGAYVETTGCGLAAYWQQYQQHRVELLKEYRGLPSEHPQPVATTWSLSFQRVEERNPAAAALLHLCAFLSPDAIQEDMLTQGAKMLESPLAAVAADGYLLDRAIEALRAYSLITRNVQTRTLAIHRLVQTVVRDNLPAEAQQRWMLQVVALVNHAFPRVDFTNWPQCEHCLSHALLCAQWIAQQQITTPAAMRLLSRLGSYLSARGHYAEAEPYTQQALALREHHLGSEHPDTAASLHNLAALYRCQGKYIQAEPLFLRALSIRQQELEAEHPYAADSLHELALLYQIQGKYTQAEPLFQQALVLYEQRLGPEESCTVTTLRALAMLYHDWGQYPKAESLSLHALALCERKQGPDHPDTATSLHILALLYRQQGNYAQAEPLAQRALAIREQQLGPEHPDIASSLSNLVLLYINQGKYAQAEPLAQRALALREQQLGPDHDSVVFSLCNLAGIYQHLSKYTEAEPLYRRALAICEQQLGPEHPTTAVSLTDLGRLYRYQGKYAQAELLVLRALSICERQLGPEHPTTARALYQLACIYGDQDKYADAELLYRRALTIREQHLGPEHPLTAYTLHDLAWLYADQNNYKEAESLYQRSLAIFIQRLGSEHPDTRTAQEGYSVLLQRKNRYES